MNFMILNRFRNELIILLATVFALSAFYYKLSSKSLVEEKRDDIKSSITEISKISELKKLWGSKQTLKNTTIFKTIVPKDKISSFKKTSEKVTVSYKGLTIKELNRITNKIMNTPLQIVQLKINESAKENYSMELTCK